MDPRLLDDINRQLIRALQENGRASYRELGELVGLSAPSVAERVRRLEDAGVIRGYTAVIDLPSVGRPLMATVRAGPRTLEACEGLEQWARETPAVLRCWRVTGDDAYHMVVAVPSPQVLQDVLDEVLHFGLSTTSLVLSQTVDSGVVHPVDPQPEDR